MTVIEVLAATLLTLGSFLVLYAVIAADAVGRSPEDAARASQVDEVRYKDAA